MSDKTRKMNAKLSMYQINPQVIRLGCSEFEDVEIRVSNVKCLDEAKAKAAAFFDHLISKGYDLLE